MNTTFKVRTAKHTFQVMFLALFLSGCASTIPEPHQPSEGHITVDDTAAEMSDGSRGSDNPNDDIPQIVEQKAFLPPPVPQPSEQDLERYTVVVNDVPVKELLFALARDASLNVDVDSDIDGFVTLNAVEQTLPQILERISRQAGLRYELQGNNLFISPDDPYFRSYKVDYVNITRDMDGSISISTQIAETGTVDVTTSGGSGSSSENNSTTSVKSRSLNHFWMTLANNIGQIVGETSTGSVSEGRLGSKSVIVNPETGIVSVNATSVKHLEIQNFIDQVMRNAGRQVLIEATIVEVTLNDRFQSGVDWSALLGGNDIIQLNQSLLPGATGLATSFFQATIQSENGNTPDFRTTLKLLKTFGDTKVLSSPKLMALNNQTAVLKVVKNEVYFTLDSEISQATSIGGQNLQSIESEVHTVPVGLVMSVTPQINENKMVTLNVRPTISRIAARVQDPGPQLIAAQFRAQNPDVIFPDIVSEIPVIAVREMESILKVGSGQVAILGGLMQDDYQRTTNAVPGLGDVPGVGDGFKQKDFQNTKSELIIFLRPVVIQNASLNGDLAPYRQYLRNNATTPLPVPK